MIYFAKTHMAWLPTNTPNTHMAIWQLTCVIILKTQVALCQLDAYKLDIMIKNNHYRMTNGCHECIFFNKKSLLSVAETNLILSIIQNREWLKLHLIVSGLN